MTIGHAPDSEDLITSAANFCEDELAPASIYRLLHEDCHRLFPDKDFADLFQSRGRRSVPPRVVAVVMVLQRLEGLSDREAVDRFRFDLRWKYAAGVPLDFPGFVHTVLVGMRMRLLNSERPNRIFDAVLDVAKGAGLVGRRRVLDSTPLFDAVATMDTVTLLRSGLRKLLKVADDELEAELRAVLVRDDDYLDAGKPLCDWDDGEARERVVDALARDGYAALGVLEGRQLSPEVKEASTLLATLLGQDLECDDDGTFRIARRVAKDRIISTVDPDTRHGHKTSSRKFDGYKGHIAIDPDSEIITSTAVTAGNVGDAEVAEELLSDVLTNDDTQGGVEGDGARDTTDTEVVVPPACGSGSPEPAVDATEAGEPAADTSGVDEAGTADASSERSGCVASEPMDGDGHVSPPTPTAAADVPEASPGCCPAPADAAVEVYGDASYGTADLVEAVEAGGAEPYFKVQAPSARAGRFSKAAFSVDVDAQSVTCPAGVSVPIRRRASGGGRAKFGQHCTGCKLRDQCTDAKQGRIINVHAKEATLQRERARQQSPKWKKKYKSTRPKVERRFGQLMRRTHGGRRARLRGRRRVAWDFALLAAAANLQRLARRGVRVPSSAERAAQEKCHMS